MLILAILVFGLLAGGVAQLILGRRMATVNWPMAFGCGIAGSFVGGLLISLLSGDGLDLRASGLIGSIVGAVLVTAAWSAITARSHH
jgi:uncharacterized membrane protein YeaQ/YmgE (transglycosylase-associated protein family)